MQIDKDHVGLGLRVDLAQATARNIDGPLRDIECLEVIAEDYYRFKPDDAPIRALAALARHIPISLHGVTLGLASASPVVLSRADGMARLCEAIEPVFWSEHLSFVRSAGAEIGHLAAPPRSLATVEGAIRNIEALRAHVGCKPVLENIATLITPPCSTLSETGWLNAILEGSGTNLLLDLHNLHANAVNSGLDPYRMIDELPLHRVRQVHLSGGVDIPAPGGGTRLLDDHVHDVPAIVFELLEYVASRSPSPMMVILERDGRYPDFEVLLGQVRQARQSLQKGRASRQAQALIDALRSGTVSP